MHWLLVSLQTALVAALWFACSVWNGSATKTLLSAQSPPEARFPFKYTLCAVCILLQTSWNFIDTRTKEKKKEQKRGKRKQDKQRTQDSDGGKTATFLDVLPYSIFIAGTFLLHRVSLEFGPISISLTTKVTTSICTTMTLSHVMGLEKTTLFSAGCMLAVIVGTIFANRQAVQDSFFSDGDDGRSDDNMLLCLAAAVGAGVCGGSKAVYATRFTRSRQVSISSIRGDAMLWAAVIVAVPAVYMELPDLLGNYSAASGVSSDQQATFPWLGIVSAMLALFALESLGNSFLFLTSPVTYALFNTLRATFVSLAAILLWEDSNGVSKERIVSFVVIAMASMTYAAAGAAKKAAKPQTLNPTASQRSTNAALSSARKRKHA